MTTMLLQNVIMGLVYGSILFLSVIAVYKIIRFLFSHVTKYRATKKKYMQAMKKKEIIAKYEKYLMLSRTYYFLYRHSNRDPKVARIALELFRKSISEAGGF